MLEGSLIVANLILLALVLYLLRRDKRESAYDDEPFTVPLANNRVVEESSPNNLKARHKLRFRHIVPTR